MRDVVIVTSLINGSASWLSVMRVITVSVNVDFVMVSVTRPSSVGAAGNMGRSGCGLLTFTVTALTPTSLGRATCTWCWLPPLRKCAGIIAWKSSLVRGRNDEGCTLFLLLLLSLSGGCWWVQFDGGLLLFGYFFGFWFGQNWFFWFVCFLADNFQFKCNILVFVEKETKICFGCCQKIS